MACSERVRPDPAADPPAQWVGAAPGMTVSRFRRLTITHAAMIGGDAVMLVALADSLFLSIDPTAARSRVLLFLVVSFAPFLVIAPLIGPVIDRAAGGRRTVRSEEHTSELQSLTNLVCRLLLEKKKKT